MNADEAKAGDDMDDMDDMPILFMDKLPSNFNSNASLMALSTLVADETSNHEEDEEEQDEKKYSSRTSKVSKDRHRKTHRTEPYTKNRKNSAKSRAGSTSVAELQMFMALANTGTRGESDQMEHQEDKPI